MDDVDRVGIMIKRHGSWRETVARYAAYKQCATECLMIFDKYVDDGMPEQWAALRSLDSYSCADIVLGASHCSIEQIVTSH